MARKSKVQNNSEKLHQAAADAAHLLSSDMSVYSAVLVAYLDQASTESDPRQRFSLLDSASSMVESMAKLGDTLAKLKGQHISVERNARAYKSAPNSRRISKPRGPKARGKSR